MFEELEEVVEVCWTVLDRDDLRLLGGGLGVVGDLRCSFCLDRRDGLEAFMSACAMSLHALIAYWSCGRGCSDVGHLQRESVCV